MEKLTDTTENTVERFLIDYRGDFGWGQSAVEAKEVCGETSNVRSSHGSSAVIECLPAGPGGNDVLAGSPNINDGTIIGEVGLRVIDIRSGDGDRLLNASRRVLACVLIIVSGGYDDGDTTVIKLKMESNVSGIAATPHPPSAYPFNGVVNTDMRFVFQAYGNNRGSAGPHYLFSDPINAGDTAVRRCG